MGSNRLCGQFSLLLLVLVLAGVPSNAWAQFGISCDPDIRSDNLTCPNGNCRRLGGNCDLLGAGNFLCLDDPASSTSTAFGPGFCAGLCSGSTGLCETNVTPCNTDFECDLRESCLIGVCSVGECILDEDCAAGEQCLRNSCSALPAPECTTDDQCSENEICLNQQCVLGDCRDDFECLTEESCVNNTCSSRCSENETWVPNPIGFPPIPLGRCQANDTLIQCCYADDNPFFVCPLGSSDCPVNMVCSTNNLCYGICGSGPCPNDLPRRPRQIPSPDLWEGFIRNPGVKPIIKGK